MEGIGAFAQGWAVDRLDQGMMVRRRLERVAVPKRVQVVIDHSAWMAKHAGALRKSVEQWKQEAALKAGGTVVWVHGPQPFLGLSTMEMERLLKGSAVL